MIIAQRVNYLCSNPACHEFTSGPHSDENKPLILGIAAHICAASPGGPRYNRSQSREQRRSPANGIWLCDCHAREIDADRARFPESLLREWKSLTEAFVAAGNPTPSLPNVSLTTLKGLRLIERRVLTAENADVFRDHQLVVENTARLDMRHVQVRVQFPEPLFEFGKVDQKPAVTAITVRAPRVTTESAREGVPWNISVPDPAKPRQMRKFNVMLIDISILPALERVALTLVSPRPQTPPPNEEVTANNRESVFHYTITGKFAFDWNREVRHLNTWTHLKFHALSRRATSGRTLSSHPPGKHVAVAGGLVG